MIQALPIWFWIWFSWWIRGNNEMPLYQWDKGKGINQNRTFNNYEIWHKYEMDLALKLLSENGWFSVWSSFQISWHTYLINLLNLRISSNILRELLDQQSLTSNQINESMTKPGGKFKINLMSILWKYWI